MTGGSQFSLLHIANTENLQKEQKNLMETDNGQCSILSTDRRFIPDLMHGIIKADIVCNTGGVFLCWHCWWHCSCCSQLHAEHSNILLTCYVSLLKILTRHLLQQKLKLAIKILCLISLIFLYFCSLGPPHKLCKFDEIWQPFFEKTQVYATLYNSFWAFK